jgi:hypothetical protein
VVGAWTLTVPAAAEAKPPSGHDLHTTYKERPRPRTAFVDEVRADDEDLAGTLRLEPVELDA